MVNPLVSVILPTYNRGSYLARSAGSILRQSHSDLELIIVDDGSTDDTQEIVGRFRDPRIRYVRRDRNGGVAAARNTGVRAASGSYLAFQDSDDEWLLEKLERQLDSLDARDKQAMSVCALMRVLGEPGGVQRVHAYPRKAADWSTGLDHVSVLGAAVTYTQCWLVPRQAVIEANGFDERLRIWDDWDLLIRLSARLKIALVHEPLVVSARGDDSLSVDSARFLHDMDVILRTHQAALSRAPRQHARLRYLHSLRLLKAGYRRRARSEALTAVRYAPAETQHWRMLFRALAGRARKTAAGAI